MSLHLTDSCLRKNLVRRRECLALCLSLALIVACDSKENYALLGSHYNATNNCNEPSRAIDVREGERRTCPVRCIEQGPDGSVDLYTTTDCPPNDPPFRDGNPAMCALALAAIPCGADAGMDAARD